MDELLDERSRQNFRKCQPNLPVFLQNFRNYSYIISGTGDVLEPEGDVIGIGSGGNYALAAGKVLMDTNMSAEEVAKKSIEVASEICVFTNNNIKIEKI